MVTSSASLSRSFDDLHTYMICVLVRGQKTIDLMKAVVLASKIELLTAEIQP